VPLIPGELGQDDGSHGFVDALMDWMDARQGGYLGWDWDVWGQPLDLISDYAGTPTPYGQPCKTRFGRCYRGCQSLDSSSLDGAGATPDGPRESAERAVEDGEFRPDPGP